MAQEESRYWDAEIETMPLDKLRKLQNEKLQEIVAYAYEKSSLYKRKFQQAGVKPSDINTQDDLWKLPLYGSAEFHQTPIEEQLTVPFEEVKQVCSTSGTTTGYSKPILFTRKDFEIGCSNAMAKILWTQGVRPSDIVQCLSPFTCMPMAVRLLGANAIMSHVGRGILDNQIRLGKELNITVIQYLPSLVMGYFRRAAELGIDIRKSNLRLVAGIGEGWANSYRTKIETDYGVAFRGMYGLSEGAEIGAECYEHGDGNMHITGESCILEVIDPETQQVLGPGEEGELVITNLYRTAMPAVRYRTEDIAKILPYEPCPCGRTHPKISMIKGRLSQIIRVEDKKFFPVDIEEVIGGIPNLGYEYQIILDKPGEQERLKVKVEYLPKVKELDALKRRVEDEFGQKLGVESEVELVPQDSIGHAVVKAQRIISNINQ